MAPEEAGLERLVRFRDDPPEKPTGFCRPNPVIRVVKLDVTNEALSVTPQSRLEAAIAACPLQAKANVAKPLPHAARLQALISMQPTSTLFFIIQDGGNTADDGSAASKHPL